ncbi:MAG: M20/M25/M40 family metallo-hydrolase, partial [Rubrobacteraceae bacterium]
MNDEAVLAAVSAESGWMEDLLVRLVEAPTVLGDEEAGQALMEAAFADCELAVRSVPLDAGALRAAPGASPFTWEVEGKRNVVADWPAGSGDGRSLILNGHIDVVPPAAEELWTHPPFKAVRDGDWLYGRGAGDMKAGLVAMTGAVRALSRAGYAPAAPVQLQSVVEEECTGHGALQCLLDGARADACVIPEPHSDHITIAQVGVLWFHVDITGVPAHAARASRLGFNAIEAATDVLAALRRLEARLNEDPPPPYDLFEHPIN